MVNEVNIFTNNDIDITVCDNNHCRWQRIVCVIKEHINDSVNNKFFFVRNKGDF